MHDKNLHLLACLLTPCGRYEPINLAVDVLFIVDIVISFRTGFWQDGLYIKTPEHVARHYLYGEFRLDFIAAFFALLTHRDVFLMVAAEEAAYDPIDVDAQAQAYLAMGGDAPPTR